MSIRLNLRLALALAGAVVACTLLPCRAASAQAASPRTVLTIHTGAETFPANPIIDAGIREAFASRPDVPIDYFAEYLEADLFPDPDATLAFRDYLRRKYSGRRIDVVIAMTRTALQFAIDYRAELFPAAPIVFGAVSAPDANIRLAGPGVTGVTVGAAYAETVKLALQLQPSTQHVFVVARSPDEQTVESVRAALADISSQVDLTYVDEETVPQLLAAIRTVPPGSVILYIWQTQQEPGNLQYSDAVARLVAAAAPVPVYGTSDLYVGGGVVGGVMRGTRDTGVRLGTTALRILTGTRAQDIPVESVPMSPVIDWRQLQRWGIDSDRLPPESRILFRQPSVWERYRLYIVGAVTLLLAQSALIVALLLQRARRREAEQTVRRGQAALRKSYARVRDLGSRLLNAQEVERSRIARELHDDISQQLAVLKIDLKALGRTIHGRAGPSTANAITRVDRIATSVHALSHQLHPDRLRLIGLVAALDGLRSELSQPGLVITVTHENVPPALPPDLTLCLFRIAQEALRNALKYSQAQHVSVDVSGVPDGIALVITDDGVGFDVDAAWGKGLGLMSVNERVEAVRGTFEIRSSPGAGTRLAVRVPFSLAYQADTVAV